ncbi:MAG: hypothetical protein ACI8RD_014558 [Bacillariaceae sp.]|jgi:hypothetical protein
MVAFYKTNTISFFCVLTMLLFNLHDTSHAFVPAASTSSQVFSSNSRPAINGASSVTVGGGRTRVIVSFSPQVHSIMSVADVSAKIFAAGLPAKILIMKDATGASSSLFELSNYADPELQAELLLDFSHVFLDLVVFIKTSGTVLNYAQVIGRISFIMIGFLPNHDFHPEEMALQVFLLGLSIQKIIASHKEQELNENHVDENDSASVYFETNRTDTRNI